MTDDHTAALIQTYGIIVTMVRRNPPDTRYLAERIADGRTLRASGSSAHEAVTRLVGGSHTTRTPNT